ncbi:MAG: hypothetical protein Q8K96_05090 [Rubrivivax sp.]|nr:hypothetical protein [Rubrivivax sp.]
MEFDDFLGAAWADHATDTPGVAERLQTAGAVLAAQAPQVAALAHLAHHVLGEHLGRWQEGIALQRELAALPAARGDAGVAQAAGRYIASLSLAGGMADLRADLGDSDRIRVTAMAAASLVERDTARARVLFQQALADAETAGLPGTDPCTRALAVTGNNLAATLEEKAARTADERDLMILAAQAARRCWALAGTWLETERAEYRLAMSWLQAGDPARARHHAGQCLEIVQANDGPALERFFAWEAIGVAARAAGDSGNHQQALAQAREAFQALDEADRVGCKGSLDKLAAAP